METLSKANHYLQEIEVNIDILHKSLRDVYLEKFKELETIVLNPVKYAKCI